MKLILIDPSTKSVSEVEYDGAYKTLAALLGCSLLDSVRLNGVDGDRLFVDDEGLLTNPNPFGYFRIAGYPGMLAGKALAVGIDDEGDTVPPRMLTVENLRENVTFIDADSMTYDEREPPPPVITFYENHEDMLAAMGIK